MEPKKHTHDGWRNNGKAFRHPLHKNNQVGDGMAMLQGRNRILVVDFCSTPCPAEGISLEGLQPMRSENIP